METYRSKVVAVKNDAKKVVSAYVMLSESRYLSWFFRAFASSL